MKNSLEKYISNYIDFTPKKHFTIRSYFKRRKYAFCLVYLNKTIQNEKITNYIFWYKFNFQLQL